MMLAFHAKDPSSNPSVVDRVPLSLVTIHPFLPSHAFSRDASVRIKITALCYLLAANLTFKSTWY